MNNNTLKQFTEQDTENYYNASDELYQSFWDKGGGLHWGYFESNNQNDSNSNNSYDDDDDNADANLPDRDGRNI